MKFEYPQEVLIIEKALKEHVKNLQCDFRGTKIKEEQEAIDRDLVITEEMLARIKIVKEG